MATANQADFPANMTAAPRFHNVDAPTGTPIDGLVSGADAPLPAELAGVDPAQIAQIMQGWNVRSAPIQAAPVIASGASTPPPAFPAPVLPSSPDMDPISAALAAEGNGEPAAPSDEGDAPSSDGGATLPPPDPAQTPPVAEPPTVQPARVLINGELVEVSPETVQAWSALAQWSASLPDHVRQTYAGIDSGDLVAITRDQLAQLQARLAAPAPAAPTIARDAWDIDDQPQGQLAPDALARIQQQLDAMREQLAGAPAEAAHVAQATVQQQQVQMEYERAAEETAARFARERQLTDDQMEGLTSYIMATNLVGQIAAQSRIVAPNGQLLSAADPTVIFERAYTQAHDVVSRFAQAAATEQAERALVAAQQQASAVDAKKAAQGAAASTPVAAITLPDRNVGPMQPHEMEAAIGNYLENLFQSSPTGTLS